MNDQMKMYARKCKKIYIVFALTALFTYNYASKLWENRGDEMRGPIIVEFPLRGEWYSPNTPGTKIPSHGTDQLGTTYAYDFIQVKWNRKGWPAYHGSLLQYLLSGIPLNEYYCWGQEIYAPCVIFKQAQFKFVPAKL